MSLCSSARICHVSMWKFSFDDFVPNLSKQILYGPRWGRFEPVCQSFIVSVCMNRLMSAQALGYRSRVSSCPWKRHTVRLGIGIDTLAHQHTASTISGFATARRGDNMMRVVTFCYSYSCFLQIGAQGCRMTQLQGRTLSASDARPHSSTLDSCPLGSKALRFLENFSAHFFGS